MTSATSQPQTRLIPSNGINIAVHDWGGTGQPLLLVHGNSFLGRIWDPIARALLPGYQPLAMDLRGHGDSDKPAEGYRREDHAADIAGVIRSLGLQRPHILAHSIGAASSLIAAGTHPGIAGPIVAIEPIIRPKHEWRTWEGIDDSPIASARARKRRHTWESREAVYETYRSKHAFAAWTPEILQTYVQYGFADLPDGTVELKCRGAIEAIGYEVSPISDPWPVLPHVDSPVLVVRGGRSIIFSKIIVHDLVTTLPNARDLTIEAASHVLPMEFPDEVVRFTREFFAEFG